MNFQSVATMTKRAPQMTKAQAAIDNENAYEAALVAQTWNMLGIDPNEEVPATRCGRYSEKQLLEYHTYCLSIRHKLRAGKEITPAESSKFMEFQAICYSQGVARGF